MIHVYLCTHNTKDINKWLAYPHSIRLDAQFREDLTQMASQKTSNTITQNVDDAVVDLKRCLLVKRMTQFIPNEKKNSEDMELVRATQEGHRPLWHRYVDKLCCLCQFKPAGDAVVSIGAEDFEGCMRLWLATNNPKTTPKALRLLRHILIKLKEASVGKEEDLDKLSEEICRMSLALSPAKINNYRSSLRRQVQRIKESSAEPNVESMSVFCTSSLADKQRSDESVVQALELLIKQTETHQNLCQHTMQFRSETGWTTLLQLSDKYAGPYKSARHIIGRFCSWRTASQFATRLSNAETKAVPDLTLHKNGPIAIAPTVEQVLTEVFGQQGPIVADAARKLAYAQELLDELREKERTCVLHAEIAVAHHFDSHNLRFVDGDRYVGCSKPSCYACTLYLELQIPEFAHRPQHGNAWFRWCLPDAVDRDGNADASATIRLARDMASEVRKDIAKCIIGGHYGHRRLFESTTGISQSAQMCH